MSPRLSLLLLVLIIGFMSWQNMHPRTPAVSNIASGYIITGPARAAAIPGDNLPLVIYQGRFSKGRLTGAALHPTTLAQRQISLLFGLEDIPAGTAEVFSKINALLRDWNQQGTLIGPIYLDYRPEKPDFAAYAAFVKALKTHMKANQHLIIPVVDAAWPESGLKLLRQESPYFLLTADDTMQAKATAKFKYGFQLKLPSTEPPAAEIEKTLRKNNSFEGFLLTPDLQKPFVKREPEIGLFPKL